MSKWPWPERLKRIVRSSPASSAAVAPCDVGAASDAADHDVREGFRELHLRERLLADHGLVQEDVVQDGSERVSGVVAPGRVLDGLRDRDSEAAGRVGVLLEDRAARLRHLRQARHY